MQLSDEGLLKTKAYINGEWTDGDGGATFSVIDPKLLAASAIPAITTNSQISAKAREKNGRTNGKVAVRNASGSHSGTRTASGDQIFCLSFMRSLL